MNVAIIIQRLDDLKEQVVKKFSELEYQISNKCLSCVYAEKLSLRADNNWWHIRAIWGIIGVIWGAVGTIFLVIVKHKLHI